ncbi:TRAP transporter large permease [Salinicola halophyticus]|uniref:TRAP transporter large permease n=1 Tax=Salinicola halophyticus TaxID=1808881 RepID=UPI003F48822E
MIELLIIGFIVLLFLGVPLGISMILASTVFIVTSGRLPLELMPQQVFRGLDHFTWLAIPLFMLAGELMNRGGITLRLVNCVKAFVGHFRGGLAYVSVITNVVMAGISGSALADAAGTGSVLIPAMKRDGYSPRFATAVCSAASTVGPIIPPSIPFILYGTLSGVSIGKMFAAGALPGLAMAASFIAIIAIIGRFKGLPKSERSSFREVVSALSNAGLALVMPVIILGGIIFGFFTATEAAAVAVVYAFIVSVFIYREVSMKDLSSILLASGRSASIVMFAIGAAGLLSWIVNFSQIATELSGMLTTITTNPVVMLLLISVLLVFLGCFMEATPLIIILTPVLLPVVTQIGVDPIHFGLIMVMVLMIGLITPPVGMVLFITAGIANISVMEVAKGSVPFMFAIIAVVILAIAFPGWVLWLPGLM